MAKRIIIGHVSYGFGDGGTERGLVNLVNYGDRERFHHVILCLTRAGHFSQQLTPANCELIELQKRNGNDFRLPGRIAAAARRCRLDILHARGWPAMVETAVAALLAGVKATVYGFHGKTMKDLQRVTLKRRWAQILMIRCYDRIVTLNRRMRSDLAVECNLPQDRIHIIGNGVDVDVFRPRIDRTFLRATFDLPCDRFIIGSIARLDPIKNHEVVIRALSRLKDHERSPLFLLVGDGCHGPALARETQRLGLDRDVILFGYSDRIPELLNCMDLFIQPSFYEGFSNTIIEAMACGLPVLATDTGGTPDLFTEGSEGFFFSPEDDGALASRIVQLQRDEYLRRIMGERARYRVLEHFSVSDVIRRYQSMYADLAENTA
jgi:sugar transferase (PEP-CTERM/EpsH1 system associated)